MKLTASNATRHATGKRLEVTNRDYKCSSCQAPWHEKHLARQQRTPSMPPPGVGWLCPRCTKTCCCQIECAGGSGSHRCCHLRRKQLKERKAENGGNTTRKPAATRKRSRAWDAEAAAQVQGMRNDMTFRAVVLPETLPAAKRITTSTNVIVPVMAALPPLKVEPEPRRLPSWLPSVAAPSTSPALPPLSDLPFALDGAVFNPTLASPFDDLDDFVGSLSPVEDDNLFDAFVSEPEAPSLSAPSWTSGPEVSKPDFTSTPIVFRPCQCGCSAGAVTQTLGFLSPAFRTQGLEAVAEAVKSSCVTSCFPCRWSLRALVSSEYCPVASLRTMADLERTVADIDLRHLYVHAE